jgi:putative tricarboxylic transport membrane protein
LVGEFPEEGAGMRPDRAFLAMVAVGSILYTVEAARIPNPPVLADPLGPRVFPLMLGLAGSALSFTILLERTSSPEIAVTASTLRDLAMLAAGMTVYALLLPRLGFLISTTLVLAAGFAYTGGRRPWLPATLFAVGVYVLFTRVLGVRLPPGILPWP